MTSKPFNAAPLYVQLRTDLTRRIARGDWKRGENIPNELDLAREYGLSPGTVRKALDWLEDAHLIIRQQGRGTFVATTSAEDLNRRFDRLRVGRGESLRIEAEVLQGASGTATPVEAQRLDIAKEAPVFRLSRLCRTRGKPLMVENLTVSLEMFPSLANPGTVYDLAALSQSDGVLLGEGGESLTLVPADVAIAAHLGLEPGMRVLLLDRIISTIEGQPAEWRQCWCNLEGYRYQVELH